MTSLPFKTALITGASSGIGKTFAYELAKKGLNIVLTARSEEKLAEISKDLIAKYGVKVSFITSDLSELSGSTKIYEELQKQHIKIDLLINNAGIGKWSNFLEENIDVYEKMLNLNIQSVVKLTHLLLPDMLKAKNGGIINISSTGALQPCPYIAVYCASKAFVLSFSEAIHGEYSQKGIKITAICPGNTKTEFQKTANANTTGMSYDSTEKVVIESIKALLKNKTNKIIGFNNYLQSFLPRLLPRKTVVNIVKNLMNKKING